MTNNNEIIKFDNFNNLSINLQKYCLKYLIVNNYQIYKTTTPLSEFTNDNEIENNSRLEFKGNEYYNNTIYVILSLSLVCKLWAIQIIPNLELYSFTINNKKDYQLFIKWYQYGLIERTKKWYGKFKFSSKKKKTKYPPIKFDMNKVILNYIPTSHDLNSIPKEIQIISLKNIGGISSSLNISNNSNNSESHSPSILSNTSNNNNNNNIYSDTNSDGGSIEFDLQTTPTCIISPSGSGNGLTSSITLPSISLNNSGTYPTSPTLTTTSTSTSINHSISNSNLSTSTSTSTSTTPTQSPKLTNFNKHKNPSNSNIYSCLQHHQNLKSLRIKMNSINGKETDTLIDIINKNSNLEYLEIDRSEITSYNIVGGGHDIALYDSLSSLLHLKELKIQMTLIGGVTPIYHLSKLTNIKKLYIEFIPSSTKSEGRCDWINLEHLLKNAPEIETLSIKDCNRVPFSNIFTLLSNNRSLTELEIQECISPFSLLNNSSGNLSNLLLNSTTNSTTNSSTNVATTPTTRVLASHIDEFPYLGLKEFLATNNYIQSLSLRYTGIASPGLLNSNTTEFQLSSSSLQKLSILKLNDKDKLNISFNIPTLRELILLPYRNRGLIRFLKTSRKISRLSLYKQINQGGSNHQTIQPSKSCFEMDELLKTINRNLNLKAFYNQNYIPQINAIDFIKSNHPSIINFVHCNDNIKHLENDLIESICINTKLESLTIMFNSSTSILFGVDEGEPVSELCVISIIFKLLSSVLQRNSTLKSLKIIDCCSNNNLYNNDYYLNSCSIGFGCPHFAFCKLNNNLLSSLIKSSNIQQFSFPFYMKKYLEKYFLHTSKLYSFILKDNELFTF